MFKNYFTVAWRSFYNQKGFAFINILGLSISLASSIFIFTYIVDELSYDSMHPDSDNTYRLGVHVTREDGSEFQSGYSPAAWSAGLKEQAPQVKEISRIIWNGYPVSVKDLEQDKILLTEKMFWAEASLPNIVHLPLLQGNSSQVLVNPKAMILSKKVADQFYPNENPIGKILVYNHPWMTNGEDIEVEVTGVFDNLPGNMTLQADYLVNINTLNTAFNGELEEAMNNWQGVWAQSYVLVDGNADMTTLGTQLENLIAQNIPESNSELTPIFRNIKDLHFDTDVEWANEGAGDINYIYIFGSIAILILVIASINYMNLATARSAKRSKEVGLRKSFGGLKQQLMLQFFNESLITTLLSLVVALALVATLLPYFNDLAQKQYTFISLFQPALVLSIVGIVVFVAFVSGSYPALYLSSFKPVEVLKSQFVAGRAAEKFRKTLVVFQFSISVILLICTGIILNQMDFISSSKLSENGDQILSIRFGGVAPAQSYQPFKSRLLQDPDISEVTIGNHLPRRSFFGGIGADYILPDLDAENVRQWSRLNVDYDFPATYSLEFIAGRNFNTENRADSNAVIINETALNHLNVSIEKVIGLSITDTATQITGEIIGVVKDFPYRSIHETIGPLAISARPHPIDQIVYVKLPKDKINEKIATIEASWKEVVPLVGFDHWFLSDEFGKMYATEKRMADLTKTFAVLAIFIACLGLLGLASYLAERKTKEIGIRKVLGATVPQIVLMLFSTFAMLLLVACAIAVPLAYFLMNSWLQNFTYHIPMYWWIFVGSVTLVFTLTMLIVGYESIKASLVNPIRSIRYE